jgi:hypothetical protein
VARISHPERRVVVSIDMESYSKRNNTLQHRAQDAFKQIMQDATEEAGLDRTDWLTQQGGDGELGILPSGTRERAVLGLVSVLDRMLREYNQGLVPEARVRLRVAVHQGLVHLDGANGYPGQPIVEVSRLVDAPQLKEALRAFPGANVALIVSESIYREVVEQYGDLRPEQFARVTAAIPEKSFTAQAWIYIPGENAATRSGSSAQPIEEPARQSMPAAPPGDSQVFNGITSYGPAAFGNHNTLHSWSQADEHGPNHGR